MGDISILTLDKIGKALGIDQDNGNLNLLISNDPKNMIKLDSNNMLMVKGVFVETIPDHNSIVWTGVDITDTNIRTGLLDSSNPLEIGKDISGNIWMRGAVTNIGGTGSANSIIGNIPSDYELSGYVESPSFYQSAAIQSTAAGNTTALFLRIRNYDYIQSFAFSANFATNVSFIMQPTIIGRAKYLFKGVFVDNAPNYRDVSWADISITNANANTGLPDSSNPLQVGKDLLGNIWMRGAVTNIGSAIAANGVIGVIPSSYQLLGYASATTFCQLAAIQSTLAGNTTALFLRMKNYTDIQSLAFSGSLASGVSFVLQPTIIGRAKS